MPLQDHMKIISVDDHLIEHPRVWTDRLPEKYQQVGPHVVSEGDLDYWQYEDRRVPFASGLGASAGRRREDWTSKGIRAEDIIPGCYDPKARIDDMDTDGVWAQLCFPQYARFAGVRFLEGTDKDLSLLCVQAYNDFVLDEWCATDPSRFIPLSVLPLWDIDLAVQELERVAGKGSRSISFPENPEFLGLPSWHTGYWDPLFAAACAANMPLSIHVGTSQRSASVSSDAPGAELDGISAAGITCVALTSVATVADLTFSHIFHAFPTLKVAVSEGGIGWIPYLKERMDYTWERQKFWTGINKDARPSELFDRHFWGCFIDDEAGLRERHAVGVDNMTIESDYPHSDTTWPDTRKRVNEVMVDVPDDEVHKIVELNARALYDFH
jgi:predicted TIM-barrel fold metal-dependent hydrolase